MKSTSTRAAVLVALLTAGLSATAAVTPDEAAKLKTTLTPLGGERAGNKDGSIPAWNGGITKPLPGKKMGAIPMQIFADEKPLFQVTAKNMAQYADLLSDGTKAMLQKYPDTFRLDVFPTHRTAAAPQHVYDAVAKNAVRCKTIDGGNSLEGCIGGTPFPIPKDGVEVLWNYLLRLEPEAVEYRFRNMVGNADGSMTLATRNEIAWQFPPYYKEATPESWSGEYALMRFNTLEPPFKAGESLVFRDGVNPKQYRQAWQYLVGQRRVRRAPTVAYDTPDFVASGANYFDEVMGFMGAPDRFQWKLIGKKELLVPYNDNGFVGTKLADAFSKHHLNPDHLRWERHRVWVVEANVAPGKRHAVPKRRYYFDEDTWLMTLMDGYDAEGKLWRTTQVPSFVVPALPGVLMKTAAVFNLQANTMSVIQALNDEEYNIVPRKKETYFTGDAVAAEAAR